MIGFPVDRQRNRFFVLLTSLHEILIRFLLLYSRHRLRSNIHFPGRVALCKGVWFLICNIHFLFFHPLHRLMLRQEYVGQNAYRDRVLALRRFCHKYL